MKKLLFLYLLFNIKLLSCTASFTYHVVDETIHFTNLSIVANAHYYWDFGNGISSNIKSPSHKYYGNGNYLATLYVVDTLTGCSSFFENWITVTKNNNSSCSPFLWDSIYLMNGKRIVKFRSTNTSCDGGSIPHYTSFWHVALNTTTMTLPHGPANIISIGRFGISQLTELASKTTSINFDKSKNYSPCSANFEFKLISEEPSGQNFLFKAMNKNAILYEWLFVGPGGNSFGSSQNNDTISKYFNDPWYISYPTTSFPYSVSLKIKDANGCTDSLWQSVILRPNSVTTSINFQSNDLNVCLYPNPTKDKINLQFSLIENLNLTIEISNALGQDICSFRNIGANDNIMQIDLSSFLSGIYFLKVQNDQGRKVFKVIKE